MRDAPGDIDKRKVTQFAIGAIKTCCQLGRQFEYKSRAFAGKTIVVYGARPNRNL